MGDKRINSTTNEDENINSVRLTNITKKMSGNENVMRLLDIIFKQLEARVGKFARVIILEEAKRVFEEEDTIGFLQLINQAEHRNLAFYLDGYYFHGRTIGARLALLQHHGHIGNLYTCAPGVCDDCENYTVTLNEYEEELRNNAIRRAREAIHEHSYSHKHRNYKNESERNSEPDDHFFIIPKATLIKEFSDSKLRKVPSRLIKPFIDSLPLLFDVEPALFG